MGVVLQSFVLKASLINLSLISFLLKAGYDSHKSVVESSSCLPGPVAYSSLVVVVTSIVEITEELSSSTVAWREARLLGKLGQ